MSIAALVYVLGNALKTATKGSLAIPLIVGRAGVVRVNTNLNFAGTDGNMSFFSVVCPISRLAKAAPSSRVLVAGRSGVHGAIATTIFTSTAHTGGDSNDVP